MKRISIHTDTKAYASNIILKPTTPVFEITNSGGLPVIINGNFRLLPQHRFGINMQDLCARFIDMDYEIIFENEFKFTWERPQTQAETGLSAPFYALYLLLYYLNRRLSYTHTTFIIER